MKDANNYNSDSYFDVYEFIMYIASFKKLKKIIYINALILLSFFLILIFFIPNKYTSAVVLAPSVNTNNSISNLASQYSSIVSLAGVSLPAGEIDKAAMGVEKIMSFDFFEYIVTKHDLFFNLVAIKDWNKKNNTMIVNRRTYDVETKKWVSKLDQAVDGKPTLQYAYKKYLERQLNITKDNKTGFLTIKFTHFSPHFAKKVLDLIILEVNEIHRLDDISIAEESIFFLRNEIEKTQLEEVRSGLNSLIQQQIEKMMIANSTPEYLYKILSSPYAPEEKSGPAKSVFLILFCIFLFFTNIVYFLFIFIKYKKNNYSL